LQIKTKFGYFLNPALALLGQGLKKSPIGQKLDFANHPYLCKGLYKNKVVFCAHSQFPFNCLGQTYPQQ
jgi:hypothetical protein